MYMIVMSCSIVDSFETIINECESVSNSPYFKLAICIIRWQKVPELFKKYARYQVRHWHLSAIFAKYMLSFDPVISNMANLKCGELLSQALYIMYFVLIAENDIIIKNTLTVKLTS